MAETLTAPRALELLREAVDERGGDYIYLPPGAPDDQGCLYAHDDGPGCGVGLALYRYGATLDDLKVMDGQGVIQDAYAFLSFDVTEDALDILAMFQRYQDDRKPWSQALAHAEIAADDLGVES